jgi:hypothetical protein
MDSIGKFFASHYAKYGEVMRLKDTTGVHRITGEALKLYIRGVLFDNNYDLKDTTQMYCTEFIWHLFKKLNIDITEGSRTYVVAPIYGGTYILPNDIWSSPLLYSVWQF